MSSILGVEPSKTRSFPIKRRVIWVSGVILPRLNFVNLLWVFNVGTMYHTLRIRFSPAMSQFQRSNPIGSIYLILMGFQCIGKYHTCFISGNPNLNQVLLCDVPSSNCSNAFLPLFPPLRLCAKVLWPEKKNMKRDRPKRPTSFPFPEFGTAYGGKNAKYYLLERRNGVILGGWPQFKQLYIKTIFKNNS